MAQPKRPSASVLHAFGASEEPRLLEGGQGQTYVAGNIVLKPVDDIPEAEWIAAVMHSVVEDGFRVARPIGSTNETWVDDGWVAWQRVDGEHRLRGGPWTEVLDTCKRFHSAIANVPRPTFFDTRDNVFVQANKMAFGEIDVEPMPQVLADVISELQRYVQPLRRNEQIIHGDFAGNVLFADGQAPAIIDFSPNWRPAAYAMAQTLVDAVLWYGGDMALTDSLKDDPDCAQLVVRATLFRLYVTGLFHMPGYVQTELDAQAARPIVEWLVQLPASDLNA